MVQTRLWQYLFVYGGFIDDVDFPPPPSYANSISKIEKREKNETRLDR